MEVAIDEACVRIIAKRQPTASDLRLVMVISKTIAELERIGDVADKICRTALEKFSQQHQPLLVSLESLGRHTIQMLHDVLDAFARMDIDGEMDFDYVPFDHLKKCCVCCNHVLSKNAFTY